MKYHWMVLLVTGMLLSSLVFGATPCPTWQLPDPNLCPWALDKGKLIGQYIGYIEAEAGKKVVVEAETCDPEGVPGMKATIVSVPTGMQLRGDAASAVHLEWTPTSAQIGQHYATIHVTDTAPGPGMDPNWTEATIYFVVRAINHAPLIGGCRALTQ